MRTVFLLTILLVLCVGACRCAPKQDFACALFSDGTVQGYSLGPDGHLTPLPFLSTRVGPTPADTDIGSGTDMTADPNWPILYVSTYRLMLPHSRSGDLTGAVPDAQSTLRPFSIENEGRLTPLSPAAVPANAPLYSLTLAAKRRLLYALSADGMVYVFRVRPEGTLALLPPAHVLGTFHPSIDPWNNLNHWGEVSAFFTLDPDERFGTLSFGASGRDIEYAEVARYRVGTNRSLHCVQDISNLYGDMNSVNVTPDSRFLYLTGSGTHQYRVRQNGTLAPLSPLTVGQDEGPAFLNTPGRLLYSAVDWPKNIGFSIYSIGKDGRLTFATHKTVPNSSIELPGGDKAGHFFYVTVTSKTEVARIVGYRVSTNGTLGTPLALPMRGVPESLVFVRR